MSADDESPALRAEVEIMDELAAREAAGEETVTIGPFSAYILVGLAQLGVQAVGVDDQRAEVFRLASAVLEEQFHGTAAGDLIDASWRQVLGPRPADPPKLWTPGDPS